MKYCPTCYATKDRSCFSKASARYDGLQSMCKECRGAKRKASYKESKEREKAVNKRWAEENPEAVKEKKERYRRSTKGKSYYNERNAKRRASKLQATPSWLSEKDQKQIKRIYTVCTNVTERTGKPHHVDHIVPLQGENVCGLHVPWNLAIIPALMNLSKSNKF